MVSDSRSMTPKFDSNVDKRLRRKRREGLRTRTGWEVDTASSSFASLVSSDSSCMTYSRALTWSSSVPSWERMWSGSSCTLAKLGLRTISDFVGVSSRAFSGICVQDGKCQCKKRKVRQRKNGRVVGRCKQVKLI